MYKRENLIFDAFIWLREGLGIDTNNLKLNCSKSKEIISRARGGRGKSAQLPSPCEGIERVDKLTILGVAVNP